jgi:Transposase
MLFLGIDWGERHHDLCLLDPDGAVLASRRIADGLAGVGELHALLAAHVEDPTQVVVGIETDRGLLVAALLGRVSWIAAGPVGSGPPPDKDVRDGDRGLVTVGDLVEAGGHRAELLAPVHQPLHLVALAVALAVKGW